MQIELIHNKKPLRSANCNGMTYIEAPKKGQYAIRIYNNHNARRMAVVAVDGINVIDGTDAGFSGPGYVLAPWETIEIPGWRRSNDNVAAFTFAKVEDSYAAKTKRDTNNVGMIGVAVFDEQIKINVPIVIEKHHYHQRRRWPFYPWIVPSYPWIGDPDLEPYRAVPYWSTVDNTTCNANTSLRSLTLGVSMSVGTAYGKEIQHHVTNVDFVRASATPSFVVEMRYATRERLNELGIVIDKNQGEPTAFPASSGMCREPAGWKAK